MIRRRAAALLAAAVLASACGGGGDDGLALDGSPRHPDAEGVVAAVTVERITLDGGREYRVSKDLASFSTYDLAATPMLHRKGQYVHLGLDGHTAEWMAGIGVVVRAEGRDPVVFYNGNLVEIDDGKAVFSDGTVLTLAEGITPPTPTGPMRAELNPTTHLVSRLTAQ